MEKASKNFAVIALLVVVIIACIFIFLKLYRDWGRKQIYPIESKITELNGVGKIFESKNKMWFLLPKGEGRPYIINSSANLSSYPDSLYEKIEIPAQDWLRYVVGKFIGWEDIPGKADKYIIVLDPISNTAEKYRICFEESGLFENETTVLMVEKNEFRFFNKTKYLIESTNEPYFINLTFGIIDQVFKDGDLVILMPVLDLPITAKKDDSGNYLVSKVVIRRVGGKAELNKEIQKVVNNK